MIEAGDLLREAKSLLDGPGADEVRLRTIVSRAYYGAYHHALQVATEAGYRFDRTAGMGMHEHLGFHMRKSGGVEQKRAANLLSSLKQQRVRADYHLDQSLTLTHAREAIATASRVVAVLSAA